MVCVLSLLEEAQLKLVMKSTKNDLIDMLVSCSLATAYVSLHDMAVVTNESVTVINIYQHTGTRVGFCCTGVLAARFGIVILRVFCVCDDPGTVYGLCDDRILRAVLPRGVKEPIIRGE